MKNNFMHLFRRHLLISRNKESSGMFSEWTCKLTIFTITLAVFQKNVLIHLYNISRGPAASLPYDPLNI